MSTSLLRLMAEDVGDLDIIGAAVQDALVRVGEISFDQKQRRFIVMLNRFRWETAGEKGPYERVRSVLSFDSVLGVKSRRAALCACCSLAAARSRSTSNAWMRF